MIDTNSSEPIYLQLADTIRQRIFSGELKIDERLDPEVDMSRDLGISRGTIRVALNLLVNEGLLKRIQGKGTFVASAGVVPKDRRMVGVIVPYFRDSLTVEMIRGIESVLHEHNYSMLFCHSDSSVELERSQISRLRKEQVAGMIIFPIGTPDEKAMLGTSLPVDYPLVFIDRKLEGIRADYVGTDNFHGAYEAVRHLLSKGHRSIACIAPPDRPTSIVERIAGYVKALREDGLFPLAAVDLEGSGTGKGSSIPDYSDEELAPVDALMASPNPPTALFCINDFIAIGVLNRLRVKGIKIPGDIDIIGFDDIAAASYPGIMISSIAQPKEEIGREAARLLLRRLEDTHVPSQDIMLAPHLVVR
jgi:DNA-binding LacI/PurR family transcriptional regulator